MASPIVNIQQQDGYYFFLTLLYYIYQSGIYKMLCEDVTTS